MKIIKIAKISYKKVFGPYTRKDGRKIVVVIEHNGKKHTISYPKFLIEMFLGRKLKPNETVDHWDSNKENNSLDNLKVIDRVDHVKQDIRRVKPVEFECIWCGKKFERSPRLLRDNAKKGKAGPFCSRQCAGQYSRKLQMGLINKLQEQPMVESEYYKMKYVEASLIPDFSDFLLNLLCYIP